MLSAVLADVIPKGFSAAQQEKATAAIRDATTDDEALLQIGKLLKSSEFTGAEVERLRCLYSIGILANDDKTLVKALAADSSVSTLRDVALFYSTARLASLYDSGQDKGLERLASEPNSKSKITLPVVVTQFYRKLFWKEPSAVIQYMIQANELPLTTENARDGVLRFFRNKPDFNIRQTSVLTALQDKKALAGVPHEHVVHVTAQLKTLQLTQALTHDPQALPALLKKGMTSCLKVASMPESIFVRRMGGDIDHTTALSIHSHAVTVNMRNNRVLTNAYQTVKGTGLAVIDGPEKRQVRATRLVQATGTILPQVDLEALFGSLDFCACDDCTSVFSPSAYYVELLQFLRNNDLDPNPGPSGSSYQTGTIGTLGTLLDNLFARRPDLGELELSCVNTNTIIPYIDLANEVMESYVVYLLNQGPADTSIAVFNVLNETSAELIAAPQHTNYEAYCILNSAVYPPQSLPYSQPIDSMRINLNYLGTSRYQLMTAFQEPYTPPTTASDGTTISQANQLELGIIHQMVLTRAADAEFLSIIQGEYIILCGEAFWPLEYFNITQNQVYTPEQYRTNIGFKEPNEYWGLSLTDMTSEDETLQTGLMFVEAQLLRRSGLAYADLVSVLQTTFINPNYPQGKPLAILESIQFSYRFLQRLVDTTATTKKKRFAKLIKFLLLTEIILPDPAKSSCSCQGGSHVSTCSDVSQMCCWVYQWFDKIGHLIVLESGEGPLLPFRGYIYTRAEDLSNLSDNQLGTGTTKTAEASTLASIAPTPIATLERDGTVLDYVTKNAVAYVQITGEVLDTSGNPWVTMYTNQSLSLTVQADSDDERGGYIGADSYLRIYGDPLSNDESVVIRITWTPQQDDCNLDNVRLRHLDGSAVTPHEYYRLHVFLRLWHKMGWTIDETDKAIIGFTPVPPSSAKTTPPEDPTDEVTFGDFTESCATGNCGNESCSNCGAHTPSTGDSCGCDLTITELVVYHITPDLLHQFVAFVQLLPLTGLEVVEQLAWFTNIDTIGPNSLYAQLFLTTDAEGIDPVFEPDASGNYLTNATTISAHQTIVLSAFNLTSTGLAAIISFAAIPDALTLSNVSLIYRYASLASILQVQPTLLPDYIALFGNPFTDATSSMSFLQTANNMNSAGFTIAQVLYIVNGVDNNPAKPLGPTVLQILQTSKTIFDGLNGITTSNPMITTEDAATDGAVLTNATLLLDPTLVQQLIGFLDGTTVYTTNAPAGLTMVIPSDLSQKLSYSDAGANSTVSTVGQLTPSQVTETQALTSNTAWSSAIERLGKQSLQFFNQNLASIFTNTADAIANLVTPGDDGTNSATKRLYFLTYFIPYLQGQLSDQLVVTTLASVVSLDPTIAEALLSDVLVYGSPPQPALTTFRAIRDDPTPNPTDWTGYLIPPTTDSYTFLLQSDTQPDDMTLNGQIIGFPNQQDDPNNVWLSNPVKLFGGRSYTAEIRGTGATQIQWKTTRSTFAQIPSGALLPNYTTSLTTSLFTAFFKAAMVVNGFNLSVDEMLFFQTHPDDFSGFDMNSPSLPMWLRMIAYTTLRGSLSSPTTTLLDLFIWSNNPNRIGDLVDTVAAVTTWSTDYINALIAPFILTISSFKNEVALIQMQNAITIAQDTSISIPSLFLWAKPLAKFWEAHQIATTISKAIRAKYSLSDWEQIVKPLNDQLRTDQQTALSAYLIVQPTIQNSGVADLNSLFDYFLIDAQICPCFQTSRLKQATSSVQLFIQRCLFGLEGDDPNVQNIDRNRWSWMSKYRVWQANREVFLYPENYMVSSLRDDKSPFYQELESELLQKDVSVDTVLTAVKNYMYSVDEVANIQVVGSFLEDAPPTSPPSNPTPAIVHIFGRTPHSPYVYFYRNYNVLNNTWAPWTPINVDIPNNDIEIQGQVLISGTYIIPFVYAGRLMIAIPQFSVKTIPQPVYADTSPMNQGNAAPAQPSQCYQIQLAFSELQNGTWTQKQLSPTAIYTASLPPIALSTATAPLPPSATTTPVSLDPAAVSQFQFVPIINATDTVSSELAVFIDVYQNYASVSIAGSPDPPVTTTDLGFLPPPTLPTPSRLGRFILVGSQLTVANTLPPQPGIAVFGNSPNSNGTVFSYLSTTDNNSNPVWRFQSMQAVASSTSSDPSSLEYWLASPTGDPFVIDYMQPTKLGNSVNYTPTQRVSNVTYQPGYQAFSNQWASGLLGTLTSTNDLDAFYTALNGVTSDDALGQTSSSSGGSTYNELARPNSIYSWEVGFHAPMALVTSLLNTQQFDLALKVLAYIFDPLAQSTAGGSSTSRFWKWTPFQKVDAQVSLVEMFNQLQPNQPDTGQYGINDWRNDPFEPFLVGRDRPVAFMKWVAVTYIQIMIAYGDYYFQQNTLETIPLALECYINASNAYGPRGQQIPKRGTKVVQTYNSLVNNWDAFSNAQVQLELAFPFSNQTQFPIGYSNGVTGLANIWGFATELYFCVPDNAQLASVRDTIDDRLFKIRHCENIQGIVETLPLYEPPINPALLVAATAQGLSLASVVNDLDSPLPNYRFNYLLQKALDICSELKGLGALFLSVKEKEDVEGLAVLRAANEVTLNNLIMTSKTLAVNEVQAALDALNQSRLEPTYRMQANLQIIGGDLSTIPGSTDDFTAANDNIEVPQSSSGLKLIQSEIDEVNNANQATTYNQSSGAREVQAGQLHQFPDLGISVTRE